MRSSFFSLLVLVSAFATAAQAGGKRECRNDEPLVNVVQGTVRFSAAVEEGLRIEKVTLSGGAMVSSIDYDLDLTHGRGIQIRGYSEEPLAGELSFSTPTEQDEAFLQFELVGKESRGLLFFNRANLDPRPLKWITVGSFKHNLGTGATRIQLSCD